MRRTEKLPTRVLLVEDDEEDVLIIRRLLSGISAQEYHLEWTADYDAALELLTGGSFDISLLDYRLGSKSGIDFLKDVSDAGVTTPIIVLTGQGDHEVDLEAMKAGAADYLGKEEIKERTLERSIRYAINQAKAKDAMEELVEERTEELSSANEALLESKLFCTSTLDALSTHIAILDEEGWILFANRAWTAFGQSNGLFAHDFSGKNYLSVCDHATGEWVEEASLVAAGIREVLSGARDSFELEYPCHSPDEERWFIVRVTRFAEHDPPRVVVAHDDITKRKQAEIALAESEKRHRLMSESIEDVFWMATPGADRMLYISPAYEKIWGKSCESLYASPYSFIESIHSEDRPGFMDLLDKSGSEPTTWRISYRVVRPDGSIRWVEDRGFPVYDEQRGWNLNTGLARDITARKQAEEALKQSEEEKSAILNSLKTIFIEYIDTNMRVVWANATRGNAIGLPLEKFKGKLCYEAIVGRDQPCIGCTAVKAMETGKTEEGEYTTPDGRTLFFCSSPVFKDAQIVGAVHASMDISERKRFEQELLELNSALNKARDELEIRVQERTVELSKALENLIIESRERNRVQNELRQSEEKYRSVVDAFDGFIYVCSPDYRIRFMNRHFISSLGHDATGELCHKILHNLDSPCPRCTNDRVLNGETVRLETYNAKRDRHYYVISTPMKVGDGTLWKQTILIDITERKLAEMNLREREADLAKKKDELEDVNTALRILLKRRDEDKGEMKGELEENILYNVQQLIIPYIDRMKSTRLDSHQRHFIDFLESNINEITSPFVRNLFWKMPNLTPMELQIAALVQQGKSIKETADFLGIAEVTVRFHRINLRKKCGLKEGKGSLKAFLQSVKNE